VFFNVKNLAQGDEVALTGSDSSIHTYAVESIETIGVEELTSGRIGELVGPKPGQVLTMITCGGEFDYVNGEYLSRTAIRATFTGVTRPAAPRSTPHS
jgi:sortase (surface protein transpeptidase)